ncbi:MAG: hypothetical protein ABFC96_18260 [Thermoguttaceae bacterium]
MTNDEGSPKSEIQNPKFRASSFGLRASFVLRHSSFVIFLALSLLSGSTSLRCHAAETRKTVIPFDFVSKFDDGRYGQLLGDLIWKKLSRQGGFVIPETMQDVRDYCESHKLAPGPETDLDEMRKIVVDGFEAQIGVWGSVERAAGAEGELYALVIKCVDFSAGSKPKVIYEKKARTRSVSEIPHRYVAEMLDALYGRKPGEPAAPDPAAEANWKKNTSLVVGDFQYGRNGVPNGWDSRAGQQREPLGRLVQWTAEENNPSNKLIRFTLDKPVAENEGVMYYSDWFPVVEGATYRFQCRWRSDGPAAKVFVKCYEHLSESGQRREVYRSQQNLKGPRNVWNTHTEDFAPVAPKYSPELGRVMLYAYMKPGRVEFDDVVVKQIRPAPAGQPAKVRRPSSESRVTTEEMQKNERRSRGQKAESNE